MRDTDEREDKEDLLGSINTSLKSNWGSFLIFISVLSYYNFKHNYQFYI